MVQVYVSLSYSYSLNFVCYSRQMKKFSSNPGEVMCGSKALVQEEVAVLETLSGVKIR